MIPLVLAGLGAALLALAVVLLGRVGVGYAIARRLSAARQVSVEDARACKRARISASYQRYDVPCMR